VNPVAALMLARLLKPGATACGRSEGTCGASLVERQPPGWHVHYCDLVDHDDTTHLCACDTAWSECVS
jgi:hypothetical protein